MSPVPQAQQDTMVYLVDPERKDPLESQEKLLTFRISRAFAVIVRPVSLVRPVSQDSPEIKATQDLQGRAARTVSRVRLDRPDLRGLLELMAPRASKETEVQPELLETKEIRVTRGPPVTPALPASWDPLAPTDSRGPLVPRGPQEKRAKKVSKESRDHQASRD